MKFCHHLLKDINFEPSSLTSCCNTRALKIPAFHYEGGSVNLDAYARHIETTIATIQTGDSVCKGCPELVETELPPAANGKFFTVSINMHRHFCNCRCSYCHLWQKKDAERPYSVLPGLKSLHEQGALYEKAVISWGGGEPTILPEFEEASTWAGKHGYFQLVHTNAMRFSPALQHLLASGKGAVNVSLDSSTPSTYSAVKGVDAYARVAENLRHYAKTSSDSIELKYIIFDKNNSIREIEGFLNFAKKLEISRISYSLNFEEVNSGAVSEKTLLAAAFFQQKAVKMGFKCSSFYIDPVWQQKINTFAGRLAY